MKNVVVALVLVLVLVLVAAVPGASQPAGFIGDLGAATFQPAAGLPAPGVPTAWLPTERLARAWQAVVTGKPFGQ